MFQMGFPIDQGDLHIGDRRTCQHSFMCPLCQVSQDQPLPVFSQTVCRDIAGKHQTASHFQRLHFQMHFCVMPKRFKVTDSNDRFGYRFHIHDFSGIEGDIQMETFFQDGGQDLQLYCTHDTDRQFFFFFVPKYG